MGYGNPVSQLCAESSGSHSSTPVQAGTGSLIFRGPEVLFVSCCAHCVEHKFYSPECVLRYDFLPRLACTGAFAVSKLRNHSEMNVLLRLELRRREERGNYDSCICKRNGVCYYSGYSNILLDAYLKGVKSPSQMLKDQIPWSRT